MGLFAGKKTSQKFYSVLFPDPFSFSKLIGFKDDVPRVLASWRLCVRQLVLGTSRKVAKEECMHERNSYFADMAHAIAV